MYKTGEYQNCELFFKSLRSDNSILILDNTVDLKLGASCAYLLVRPMIQRLTVHQYKPISECMPLTTGVLFDHVRMGGTFYAYRTTCCGQSSSLKEQQV